MDIEEKMIDYIMNKATKEEQEEFYLDTLEETSNEEQYCPSSTAGDYSPSSPWNAPGMSIKDFI